MYSVVVSAMVSETRIFTCYEFPEWMRWLWVAWALLPTIAVSVTRAIDSVWTDFTTGLGIIGRLFVPLALATMPVALAAG